MNDATRAAAVSATPQPALPDPLHDDVDRLFQFAVSKAVVPIQDDVIRRVVAGLAKPLPRSVEDSTELWAIFNLLTGLVHPATVESVRAIQDLADDQRARPNFFRWWFKDSLARLQIGGSIVWVVVTLFVLVCAQLYALTLSSILEEIHQAELRYQTAAKDLDLVDETIAASTTAPPTLQKQRDHLDEDKTAADDEVTAGYGLLLNVAGWASWLAPEEDNDRPLGKINTRNISQAFLKGFALYFLPLIYGLLGANVYILRQLMKGLDGWNLTVLSRPKYSLRRALGALVGATFGLLFDSPDAAIAKTGFSLAALAFLGGYSAELFFTMLDTFIDKVKATFSTPKDYAPKQDGSVPPQAGG